MSVRRGLVQRTLILVGFRLDSGRPSRYIRWSEVPRETPSQLFCAKFSVRYLLLPHMARVAQLVEQRTENPRVGGSNPPPGTTFS